MAHTPGPWTAIEDWGEHISAYAHVAEVRGNEPDFAILAAPESHPFRDAEANARLIAAAPELLAALREIAARIFARDGYVSWSPEEYDALFALITKATGE